MKNQITTVKQFNTYIKSTSILGENRFTGITADASLIGVFLSKTYITHAFHIIVSAPNESGMYCFSGYSSAGSFLFYHANILAGLRICRKKFLQKAV